MVKLQQKRTVTARIGFVFGLVLLMSLWGGEVVVAQLIGGGGAGGAGGIGRGGVGSPGLVGPGAGRTGLIQRYGPGVYSPRGGAIDRLRGQSEFYRQRNFAESRLRNNPYNGPQYGLGSYSNADFVPLGARTLQRYGPYRFNNIPFNPLFPPWGHFYDFQQAALGVGFYSIYRSPLYTYLWRFGRQPYPQELGVSPSLPFRPGPYQPENLRGLQYPSSDGTNNTLGDF
ncbi:hypothetical protein JD969_02320 [Planctomycetota bacterium]|nr:hypothetical protein JD969_02320 [Planctomycetota bacterium]